ncbi:hypothetical protein [Acidovorax sp. PRC11]|uniref:hypothetical protein n=1 Tax=Acidovorax sp. PRC11 TaxID=2962592 RepID=UPI0028816368|nr:hypothetical protein [Acidovorax sp. PRC11]MDT0138088.1 hypothetical protein [Acidovorax sp. PRC11]
MPKRSSPDHSEALRAVERLLAAKPETDDAAAELWQDSEGLVDFYLDGVDLRSHPIPSREELGQACFWMAWLVEVWSVREHQQLIFELLSPSLGVAMYELRPRVAALRQACLVALEKMATEQGQQVRQLLPEDDIPF